MSLISIQFFAFLALLLLIYYTIPSKWQWLVPPVFSILFYISYGVGQIVMILSAVLLTYGLGLGLNHVDDRFHALRSECKDKEARKAYKAECTKWKKRMMLAGLLLNFGIWAAFKFMHIFSFSPLGISIYTFIGAGYCIDVYRAKYRAERNLLRYCSFMMFFPHIVQGPFSRYDALGKTLFVRHAFDFDHLEQGMLRLLWGCFKKLVIADRMLVVINTILPKDSGYGGVYVFLLFILLPIQLYADFSGYMDIVAGVCHMMGITLQENFMQPFFARSIDEFWRRWHITLGAWFKDYLFYPISMSKIVQKFSTRCKKICPPAMVRLIPSYIALFFVWSATGLWHGSSPNFLLWGWINLFCIVSGMQLKPVYGKIRQRLHLSEDNKCLHLVQMIRTFLIFGFAEMVSDVRSVHGIMMKCRSLFVEHNWRLLCRPMELFPGLEGRDLLLMAVGVLVMLLLDILKERGFKPYDAVGRVPVLPRYVCYVTLFYAVLLFGYAGAGAAGGFMYEQF